MNIGGRELLLLSSPHFADNPCLCHARPENLVEMQSEEALAALAREVPQEGRHQPDPVGWGGALAELVDEEKRSRSAAANHVGNLHVRVRQQEESGGELVHKKRVGANFRVMV